MVPSVVGIYKLSYFLFFFFPLYITTIIEAGERCRHILTLFTLFVNECIYLLLK